MIFVPLAAGADFPDSAGWVRALSTPAGQVVSMSADVPSVGPGAVLDVFIDGDKVGSMEVNTRSTAKLTVLLSRYGDDGPAFDVGAEVVVKTDGDTVLHGRRS